ncbi:uncharacterized protein LOC135478009 [Liolophura sinensis]|uniref:uncharacterized protein LOC135478009 n=1 Tax=Liolophura sinensis TaxID=3198878 RepID=UPI003158441B
MDEPDELVLLENVCGKDVTAIFSSLQAKEERLIRLEEIFDITNSSVFSITSIQFDPSQYNAESLGYNAVRVGYSLLRTSYVVTMKDPVNPTNPVAAIPVISQLLFEELVK